MKPKFSSATSNETSCISGDKSFILDELEQIELELKEISELSKQPGAINAKSEKILLDLLPRTKHHLKVIEAKNQKLENEVKYWTKEIKTYSKHLHKTYNSKSYKTGRAILWPLIQAKSVLSQLKSPKQREFKNSTNASINSGQDSEQLKKIPAESSQTKSPEESVLQINNYNTGLSAFDNWHSLFHFAGNKYGTDDPLVSDQIQPIIELNNHYSLKEKKIVELGALEGANTKQLLDYGAKHVLAIEQQKDLFLKCLITKNEFAMSKSKFLFGDFHQTLAEIGKLPNAEKPDLIFASGVLYHMEHPIKTIDMMCKASDNIFIWTQYATNDMPAGTWVEISDSSGNKYKGREHHYKSEDSIGGSGSKATWLTKESIEKALEVRGFSVSKLGEVSSDKGKAIKLLASRN